MGTDLNDATPFHNDKPITIFYRREPMGDNESRASFQQGRQRFLNEIFVLAIER